MADFLRIGMVMRKLQASEQALCQAVAIEQSTKRRSTKTGYTKHGGFR